MSIKENLENVLARLDAAARRCARNPRDIALMAVTKTVPAEKIQEAYEAGMRLFGENRVQEFSSKTDALRSLERSEWHMIGHLQSNKAGKAAELFSAIDSVDSLSLTKKLNSAAQKLSKKMTVLIEINIAGEEQKSGITPDCAELEQILTSAPQLESLRFRGLMTVPPFTENPEDARVHFRQLRQLRDHITSRKLPGVSMDVLSMGMSHDFEIAIEEGSTCVRVGTAIFGERTN